MEVKHRTAKTLVSKLGSVSEQTRTEALCELRLISKQDAESRPLIADARSHTVPGGDALLAVARRPGERGGDAAQPLHLQSREPHFTAAVLFSLLTVDNYRPIIGSKRDIVYALIDIVRNPNSLPRSIKDSLKALFGISLYPLNRATMIELGAVPAFVLVGGEGRPSGGGGGCHSSDCPNRGGVKKLIEAFRRVSGIGVMVDLLDPSTGLPAVFANRVLGFTMESRMLQRMGVRKGRAKAIALLKVLDAESSILQDPRFDSLSSRSS
ncbi:ARM repeat superfamily protein [Actinidia rufa]|uniref:ARM repeat superfamily protein n=1 Tax=Actinidia rufa TaxID=165716 RepID=A0A7J0F105_9ERIC|nr:ARM repeat superfamily protein [Actinidia rufa]